MSGRLDGAAALVTGASSGIGEATALALAAEGAAVAMVARRGDRLDSLAERVGALGTRALPIEADVTDERTASAAVDRAASELGRLDIVVNNAGVMLLGPVVGAPLEEWERMIDVNVRGLLYCSRAAFPHLLKAAKEGSRGVSDLVNISSVAGRRATAGAGVYNATKHAVGAFSEALRQELAGQQVRVSLIEPGAVATELSSHNRPEIREQIDKRFGHIERLQSEDIADAIAYVVTRAPHVAVNEVLIRPTGQVG